MRGVLPIAGEVGYDMFLQEHDVHGECVLPDTKPSWAMRCALEISMP